MAYKRTTSNIGKTKITRTQNSNGNRTYSQSTGQKFKGGGSTRTTRTTKANGKTVTTYTSTSPSGWVTKRVLNPTSKKPKTVKPPKSKPIKNYAPKLTKSRSSRRIRKSKPLTMGQMKVVGIIFALIFLFSLFSH